MNSMLAACGHCRDLLQSIQWNELVSLDRERVEFQVARHFELLGVKAPDLEWCADPDEVSDKYHSEGDTWVVWQDVNEYLTRLHDAAQDRTSLRRLAPWDALTTIQRHCIFASQGMAGLQAAGATGMAFVPSVGGSVMAFGGWDPFTQLSPGEGFRRPNKREPQTYWNVYRHSRSVALDNLDMGGFIRQDQFQDAINAGVALTEAMYHGLGMTYVIGSRVVMTPRPIIYTDDRGRLHRENGPAVHWHIHDPARIKPFFQPNEVVAAPPPLKYAKCLWYFDGVELEPSFIIKPDTITIQRLEGERNAERRRVLMKLFGYDRYLQEGDAKKIHSDDFGTLWRRSVEDDEDLVLVEVVNSTPEPDGTFKNYWLRVDPDLYDGDAGRIAQAAVASTWRTSDGDLTFEDWRDYAPLTET